MWNLIIAVPLIVHGLAHLSGFITTWTHGSAGFAERPWIFSPGVQLHSPLGRVFGLLWLAAAVTLVGSGAALLAGLAWWPTLALCGAGFSLLVIVPWWNSVPPGAKVGAAFDLLVLPVAIQSLWITFGV